MDKWKLKAFAKIIITSQILATLFIIYVSSILVIYGKSGIGIKETIEVTLYFISIIAIGGVVIFTPVLLIYIFTNIIKKKNEINSDEYYREIEKEYTPAIASFLLDYKIENNEVILATILDLSFKKYLKISKENKKLEIEVINPNLESLYSHEKYIINCIKEEKLIDMYEFKKLVQQNCIECKLVVEKEINEIWETIFLFCLRMLIPLVILAGVFDTFIVKYADIAEYILCFDIFLIIILLLILNSLRRHTRTKKGKELAIEFKGLKNFIKDYTLLPQRDINYVNIAERYLPFALALGEAKKLENLYVEYNNLISNYIK